MVEYWWRVLRDALGSSIEAIGYSWQTLVYLIFTFILVAWFVWRPKGLSVIRKNVTSTLIKVVLWGIIAWIPFFFFHVARVSYLRWKDADALAKSMTETDSKSRPNFAISVEGAISFYDQLQDSTFWLPLVTLVNGGAPSSVVLWKAHYKSPTMEKELVIGRLMNESLQFKLRNGAHVEIQAKDLITQREAPVAQGELVQGRLLAKIPGRRGDEVSDGSAFISVTAIDYRGGSSTGFFRSSGTETLQIAPREAGREKPLRTRQD